MIGKLESELMCDASGKVYAVAPPPINDIATKVNEIISYLNRREMETKTKTKTSGLTALLCRSRSGLLEQMLMEQACNVPPLPDGWRYEFDIKKEFDPASKVAKWVATAKPVQVK